MTLSRTRLLALATAFLLLVPFTAAWGADRTNPLDRIEHLIVIYQENWSFDGLFDRFPGANGLDRADTGVR